MQTKSSIPESGANGQAIATTTDGALLSGVAREFRNFVADVEDLVKATSLLTGEELARAKAKLGERVAAAKKSVEQVGGAIADGARKTATATNEYVHERPWTAVGAGAAAGLLLGFFLARRN